MLTLSQTIDLVDHDRADRASRNFVQQALQGRPLHGSTREPSVVISCLQRHAALVFLAGNECLAGFSLGLQGVEGLFKTLF